MKPTRPLYLSVIFSLMAQPSYSACTDLIALSKTTSQVVQSQDSLESNASTFCNEYKNQSATSNTANYEASYKFLSASMGQSSASKSEVASKYCSSDSNLNVRKEAYRQYVESISPSAYAAYEACVKFSKQDITFDVNPSSILPRELIISASFAPTKESTSILLYSSSKDVTCKWTTKANDRATTLSSGTSTSLECERAAANNPSFISILEQNSGAGTRLTIPWPAYTDNGVPINLVNQLQKRTDESLNMLESLNRSLVGAVVAFNLNHCPSTWEEYTPAYGRFIRGIDKSGSKLDPTGLREAGTSQEDLLRKHAHDITLSGASGNNAFVTRTPAWGYDNWHGGATTTSSKEIGGDETRPKNVALLYCIKR
jgi:hypothetical protein